MPVYVPESEIPQPEPPSAEQFASELIDQLLDDLNGVLYAEDKPFDDARDALHQLAAQADGRGATLVLLARAALSAYNALTNVDDGDDKLPAVEAQAVSTLLDSLLAGSAADKLLAAEARLQQHMSTTHPDRPPLWETLAQAIYRLYDGMRSGDDQRGSSGLFELRAMIVHLDATATALETDPQLPARRTLRPDRFHDLYAGYLEAVQGQSAQAAEQSLQEHLADDPQLAADLIARIRSLVMFLDALRKHPHPILGNGQQETQHLGLITAAAIAPLHSNGLYAFGELAQIATYNRQLMQVSSQSAPH